MKIIHGLEQGSESWLEYRRKHIMATDCSIILGSNNFSDPVKLYRQKMGIIPPDPENDAMRHGKMLEEEARVKICEFLGINFTPVVVSHDKETWAASSLDGLSDCGRFIIEIKCPTTHKKHEDQSKGIIAEYYKDQVRWQLYCTGAEVCYFFSYRPKHIAPLAWTRFNDYPPEMVEKCRSFYFDNLCAWQEPWTFKARDK